MRHWSFRRSTNRTVPAQRTHHLRRLTFLALGMAGATVSPGGAATQTFVVDSSQSRIAIEVGKAGALSFLAGHTHEVQGSAMRGTLEIDTADPERSQVHLEIDASALTLTGKGDPPADVPKVQRGMLSDEVLDVARYPTISFQSSGVSIGNRTPAAIDMAISGTLTLRGTSRSVTIPVHVDVQPHIVTGSGQFTIKQTEYGIKPVSVGGIVAVKDALNIRFTIVGRQ